MSTPTAHRINAVINDAETLLRSLNSICRDLEGNAGEFGDWRLQARTELNAAAWKLDDAITAIQHAHAVAQAA